MGSPYQPAAPWVAGKITSSILMPYWRFIMGNMRQGTSVALHGCASTYCMCVHASIAQRNARNDGWFNKNRKNKEQWRKRFRDRKSKITYSFLFLALWLTLVHRVDLTPNACQLYIFYCSGFYCSAGFIGYSPHIAYRQHGGLIYGKKMFLTLPLSPSLPLSSSSSSLCH